jgi:hypothetical protein
VSGFETPEANNAPGPRTQYELRVWCDGNIVEGGNLPLSSIAEKLRGHADRLWPAPSALAVLRDLVALEDEPHPNGHTSEECYAWQDDYRQRNTAAWARARALITEHTTDEEMPRG